MMALLRYVNVLFSIKYFMLLNLISVFIIALIIIVRITQIVYAGKNATIYYRYSLCNIYGNIFVREIKFKKPAFGPSVDK